MQITGIKKRMLHPFARRFFAGETLKDALNRAKSVNAAGMSATLDFLGEDTTSPAEARAASDEYMRVLDEVSARGLDASLAVKLTHIGLDIDPDMATGYALALGEAASGKGLVLWLDMEGSGHTSATIEAYRMVRKVHPSVGIALQAYLRRTPDDLAGLVKEGALVRLVKGAYREPPEVALSRVKDIRRRYLELMAYLSEHSDNFAVGTHDRGIIEEAVKLAGEKGRAVIEFQMLMGMRDDLKAALVNDGKRVLEYIPYGTDWYGYGIRRLTEKKRNAVYFAMGLIGR